MSDFAHSSDHRSIHEAYLRLIDVRRMNFQDRAHFLAVCAQLMRRILIESARDRKAKKRGGNQVHLSLDLAPELAAAFRPDLLAIDDALGGLATIDDRKAKVVELRFYGGLTEDETAAALNISVDTVIRDWKFARAGCARILPGVIAMERERWQRLEELCHAALRLDPGPRAEFLRAQCRGRSITPFRTRFLSATACIRGQSVRASSL